MNSRRSGSLEKKSTADDGFTTKLKGEFKEIITKITKHPSAEPFLYPVDKSTYPEYYEVIERPMDLSTLRKSLNDFTTIGEALETLRLLWKNCLEFNVEGSDIASTAILLGNEVEKMVGEKFGEEVVSFAWNIHAKKSKRGNHKNILEGGTSKEKVLVPTSTSKSEKKKSRRIDEDFSLNTAEMKEILQTIQSSEYSSPFEKPVREEDAPGYFDLISFPMDLQTVKKKLRSGAYDDHSIDFLHDLRLISENCLTYNDPDSDIANFAKSFEELVANLILPFKSSTNKPPHKRVKEEKQTVDDEVPNAVKIKMEKKIQSASDLSTLDTKTAAELLMHVQEFEFAEPFLFPVDVRAAPGYSKVISTPMDLSTVEKRLKKGIYGANFTQFVEDIRIIWSNCLTYNDEKSDISQWAVKCSTFFESELAKVSFHNKDQKTKLSNVDAKREKSKVESARLSTTDKSKGSAVEMTSPQEHQHFLRLLQTTVNKNKELLRSSSVLKVDSPERTILIKEYCQRKAAEKFKDVKHGHVVVPGLLEIMKFGEVSNRTIHRNNVIFPVNFVSMRTVRVCLIPEDIEKWDVSTVTPFVPVNIKSSVVAAKDHSSIKFRLTLDNGVMISESDDPRVAWSDLQGKELQALFSIASKLRQCRAVFNRLCASPDSVAFLEQIPLDSPDGFNYYKSISAPMWLREVHRRLVDGVYDNEYDFAWDVRLIFRNCQSYNKPTSTVFIASERLSLLFEYFFLNWVINVQDKSVACSQAGEWDSWKHLRYFDQPNLDEHFCFLTKQHASTKELLQCAWCEDEYLPSSFNLPSSRAGMKMWGCPRCSLARDLANGDMTTVPIAQSTVETQSVGTDSCGTVFVTAPQVGTGWNQARRKPRSSSVKNHFLSPLGYEVFSQDDIQAQKEFESTIDEDLINARAKEFKDQNPVAKKSCRRSRGRKDRKKRQDAVEEEDNEEDLIQSLPIDTKCLEEEGRIVSGRLVDFSVPPGFQLRWFINSDEDVIFKKYAAGEDIAPLLDWKQPLDEKSLKDFGFFGFEINDVRMRIEALPNTPQLANYQFLFESVALEELKSDIEQQLSNANKLSTRAESFQNELLHKRWKFELERIFPPEPQQADHSQSFSLEAASKISNWGFKMLVSKAFPVGGVEILLSLWDLIDSSKTIIGNTYFSLLDLIGSLNPPQSLLPTPSQVVFDEIGCIFTEQLLLDCRHRTALDVELEWQNVLLVHPINVLTWPKILEKCLLLRNLPLLPHQAKIILESSVQGDASVHLKVLCLLYNHPYIDLFVGNSGRSPNDISVSLQKLIDNTLQSLVVEEPQKLDDATFCSSLLEVFDSELNNNDQIAAQIARNFVQWLQALLKRIGFLNTESLSDGAQHEDRFLSSEVRSWGGFVSKNGKCVNSQFLSPFNFNRTLSSFEIKMNSLNYLERCLSLLSSTETESMNPHDRLAVYSSIWDNVLSCRAFENLYNERDHKFQERFQALPSIEPTPVIANLTVPSSLPRNDVCYFTGIPVSTANEVNAWVVVPPSLLRGENVRNSSASPTRDDSTDASYSLRVRRQEPPEDVFGRIALKYAVVQLLLNESAAVRDLESYEEQIAALTSSFELQTPPFSLPTSTAVFARSQPIGFDRYGNAAWLLGVQENMCIFEHDVRGKTLDPLDSNTREPCLLLRDRTGQWYYHSSVEFGTFLADLSSEIPCEWRLKQRLIERFVHVRSILSRGALNIKPAQHLWLERKVAIERWVCDLSLFSGPNETHRCRQLEVVWARCIEARSNVYCSLLHCDEEDTSDRSQRAEREAILRKQKRIRDAMVEEAFDLHPVHGWFHLDNATRLRQLSASCGATRMHGDPAVCQTFVGHMARSPFLLREISEGDDDDALNSAECEKEAMDVEDSNVVVENKEIEKNPSQPNEIAEKGADDEIVPAKSGVEDEQQQMEVEGSIEDGQTVGAQGKKLHSRAVEQLHILTGEVVRIYPSGKEAATFMGIAQSGISLCVTGQKTESNGFRWRNYEGPPIDFDSISHLQSTLEDLRSMQVIRGRVEDERMTENTLGKTKKIYDAIQEAFERSDRRGIGRVPAFRPPVPLSGSTVQALPIIAPTHVFQMNAVDRQNFTFPSPPAFPKIQNHIVTSSKTASSKLLKLKGELFNMVYAFPEKGIKWPDLDPAKEVMVREAGEAAIRAIQDAQKSSNISSEEVERLADKASRKARRRLRRKLALDHFTTSVQSATTPQELLSQVIVLEHSIPSIILFLYNKRALPCYANTSAEVAVRLFALDRAISYKDIVSVENAPLLCPFKLRVQFSPRCCASPHCMRFLGHTGKCSQAGQLVSRLPDHFQLAPSSENMTRAAAPPPVGTAVARPVVTPTAKPQPVRLPPDDILLPLASIVNRSNVDIEIVNPYFPSHTELLDAQWV